MQEYKLTNANLNRLALSNAVSKPRNKKKAGKKLYLSAIHKRLNKAQQFGGLS